MLLPVGCAIFGSSTDPMADMQEWTGGGITLLGNIPPRDVLAQGTPEDVAGVDASHTGRALREVLS